MAFSGPGREEYNYFVDYDGDGSADLEGFDHQDEFRSIAEWPPLLPPLAPQDTRLPSEQRIRAADYETGAIDFQLPPLYQYQYQYPYLYPYQQQHQNQQQTPHLAFSSHFADADDYDPLPLTSPLSSHNHFTTPSSAAAAAAVTGAAATSSAVDGPSLSSPIPTLACPSVSSSISSAAPRANHDSLPFAQPQPQPQTQHLPSLPQLRLPATLPEPPTTQQPDPTSLGSPPGSGQDFFDYMTHFCSARYTSALQELEDFTTYATDDLLSPTLLVHPELYQNNDDFSPPTATNATSSVRSQLPAVQTRGGDFEVVGLTKTEPGFVPSGNMPSSSRLSEAARPSGIRKRPPPETAESSLKRRRTPAATSRSRPWIENRGGYGASSTGRPGSVGETKSAFGEDDDEDVQIIDLSNTDKVPEELLKPAVDTSTKLSGYECIICMDSCTDITVTHCGHLFCGNCLHQSINMNPDKKICPICRQKLELRPSNGRQPTKTAKTYFHLELKLMPKNRQGKMPATR